MAKYFSLSTLSLCFMAILSLHAGQQPDGPGEAALVEVPGDNGHYDLLALAHELAENPDADHAKILKTRFDLCLEIVSRAYADHLIITDCIHTMFDYREDQQNAFYVMAHAHAEELLVAHADARPYFESWLLLLRR